MSENSKIEWTDHTFNPWEGCQKVGPGCDHCYAETRNARFGGGTAINWGPGAERRRTSPANWRKPLAWDAAADTFTALHGRRQRVFCASLADVFDNQVSENWRYDLFELIAQTPNLDWLLLTKRIGNVKAMVEDLWDKQSRYFPQGLKPIGMPSTLFPAWPWPNVWLGATVVNQEETNRDIPKLLATPARVRFLSMEPLLGPVNLREVTVPSDQDQLRRPWDFDGSKFNALQEHDDDRFHQPPAKLDWVIAGGESGPGARPSHPQWYRALRDQCAAAGVPFLFKQWGEWAPHPPTAGFDEGGALRNGTVRYLQGDGREPDGHFRRGDAAVRRIGKKAAGRRLDGVTHDGFPS